MSPYYYTTNAFIHGLSEFYHEKALAKAHKIIVNETWNKFDKFPNKQLN
jgi:hypothetical protein